MDFIENKCEQCLYFEGDLSTGNCECTNGGLEKELGEIYITSLDWEEECEGFAPNRQNSAKIADAI